jgi:hypothetical protein
MRSLIFIAHSLGGKSRLDTELRWLSCMLLFELTII